MYFFFILFFLSLTAIIFMIGRKFILINNVKEHDIDHTETFLTDILDFDKIKHLLIENLKKIEHIFIWITVRTYLISKNFINKKSNEIIVKIKNRLQKDRQENIVEEKKEVSRYIKIISEYRQKIRKIKHKIREEEGIE